MKQLKFLTLLTVLLTMLLSGGEKVSAQNATTDTLDEGGMYLEANIWTGTQSHTNGGMQVYGGRFSYGIRRNLEIGVNASFGSPNDPEYPLEIQPNIKYKFYENENSGIQAAGGAIVYIPVAKRAGTDTFTMVYANVSKDVEKMKGARFTAGSYALLGRNKDFGSRSGFNFSYDQPISKKVTFSAQWTTGKNRFGYFTPGLSISLPKNTSVFLGYSVGNYDYDNHGPYISVGTYRF